MSAGVVWEYFKDCDQIPLEDIIKWLDPIPSVTVLENYLGNKSLNPQCLPVTELEMKIDLAILKSRLSQNKKFINEKLRKIVIPYGFMDIAPDLSQLVVVFVDALLLANNISLAEVWRVALKEGKEETIGSLLQPKFDGNNAVLQVELGGNHYLIKQGSLVVIPCQQKRCKVDFKMNDGTVVNLNEGSLEVYGGKLGLMIDGRRYADQT